MAGISHESRGHKEQCKESHLQESLYPANTQGCLTTSQGHGVAAPAQSPRLQQEAACLGPTWQLEPTPTALCLQHQPPDSATNAKTSAYIFSLLLKASAQYITQLDENLSPCF